MANTFRNAWPTWPEYAPIKQQLIAELGITPEKRRVAVMRQYGDAETVIGIGWDGVRGYHPESDPLLKKFQTLWRNSN
jgi:hypothetical protein